MGRWFRFLAGVVGGAVLLLLVAFLIGNAYYERAPRDDRPRRVRPAPVPATPPVRKRIVIPPPINPPYHLLRDDDPIDGPTRFVRRLEAGTRLRALAGDLDRGLVSGALIEPGFLALLPYLLSADGLPPPDYRRGLRKLTQPRRDREALYRHDGPAGRLRVWTLSQVLDVRAVQSTGNLLSQLIAVAGHAMPQGVDILCTPKMGLEVFPEQAHKAGAAGLYFRADRYCVVRSTMKPEHLRATMRHELVHAYSLGPAALRSAPRFVTEGIAEYLLHLGPRDGGFRIPPRAMRDELAYLVRAFEFMERRGVDLSTVEPSWFLKLKPWEFYGLPFGYPTALAMHAYIGGAPIEEAMRSRSPAPLVKALSDVRWSEFREWLQREADGGDAEEAWFTNDGLDRPPGKKSDGESGWEVLRRIGAKTKSVRRMAREGFEAMRTAEQQKAVLRLLGRNRGSRRVVVASDLSNDMDRELGRVPKFAGESWEEAEPPATPREVVGELLTFLESTGETPPRFLGLTNDLIAPEGLATVARHAIDDLPAWLDEHAEPRIGIVLCSAQRISGRTAKSILKLPDAIPTGAVVLLIDLSPRNGGELELLARELARLGRGMRVAYWRP